MELAILGTLATLLTIVTGVLVPVLRLNKTITRNTLALERVSKDLDELSSKNNQSHERIHGRIDRNDERIDDHETRITVLENHV